MGTVDGKYSSPPSVSPAAPNFNVVVRRGGAPETATSRIALALNIEIGAQGGGAASGGEEYFPSTVGHFGFADKRTSFFGFLGRTEKALRAYPRGGSAELENPQRLRFVCTLVFMRRCVWLAD